MGHNNQNLCVIYIQWYRFSVVWKCYYHWCEFCSTSICHSL